MAQMFDQAKVFNQNLCRWKDDFPYNNAENIFRLSGCRFDETPATDQGSFCIVSDCGPSPQPSLVPSSQPSLNPSSSGQPSSWPSASPSTSDRMDEDRG
mmetsp:Transcript_21237/g.27109  ORF Transcript_21237/g.27109 Transcript_21237/m.27109 type:complete len:99 (-) Transcript_21237:96-392(-)